MHRTTRLGLTMTALLLGTMQAGLAQVPATTLPSEAAANFVPVTSDFDYTRREVMIPMRDGVHLKTVILIPRGAKNAPILLTRTPYGAVARTAGTPAERIATLIGNGDVADDLVARDGYIRVFQDIRGKMGSEGDFVMNRPLIGPLNPTKVDESTDAYDTIDWLVKNTPQSNGRVGILGISYDGYETLMALFHPHPALRAAVPINAMVDGWRGDDWFHNGAFRTGTWNYVYSEESTRDSALDWWARDYDEYDDLLQSVSAGEYGASRGLRQLGFFNKIVAHPTYDSFWQDQAVDKLLAKQTLTVPTMLVHSLWDQEDIYGNYAIWKALKPHDSNNDLFLTMGPWFHHQERLDGTSIGAIAFRSDTAAWWRQNVLKPFFDRYLKDDAAAPKLPVVTAFQTGTDTWQSLPAWPACAAAGCRIVARSLFLQPAGGLSFANASPEPHETDYVSDPAKPVPFIPRPVHTSGADGTPTWQHWLVSDQRDVASRPDVVSWQTPVLDRAVTLAGQPLANIVQKIGGSDVDLVVKLIDVYPAQMGRQPALGGYQLMVSADILRGRYRLDFAHPAPIPSGVPLAYKFALPPVNHVFLPGHRIMVQLQASWFPLYDRNPQTYVTNVFWAKPGDYRAETIGVLDGGAQASFLTLPVVQGG